MADTVKVLLSGDVNGKFSSLLNRVANVNKGNGPFDLLLCTGNFLPPSGEKDEAVDKSFTELDKYLSGTKPVPVPTYFIGARGASAQRFLDALDGPENKADIHYLGKSGMQTIKGLSIAFLDTSAEQDDVKDLYAQITQAEGDIDLLLTSEWPAQVTQLCAPGAVPEGLDPSGSQAIADLALRARPRYHIASGKTVFFARVPYINKDLGAGPHATRFIGLATVGNADKQKSLHALGLQPAVEMDADTLQQQPPGTTPCPYAINKKRHLDDADVPQGQDWRWDSNKRQRGAEPSYGRPNVVKDDRKTIFVRNIPYSATEDDVVSFFSACGVVVDFHRGMTDGKLHGWGFVQFESVEAAERACQMTDINLMGRDLFIDGASRNSGIAVTGQPVQGCWFCLSSEEADLSLVVSVGEEMYVAMDKGPINGQHVLVLPIEHRPNSLSLSPAAHIEVERYLSALRSCFASQGRELLAFERYLTMRGRGGNHMQLNAVAIPASAAKTSREELLALAKEFGVPLKPLEGPAKGEGARAALQDAVGSGEYFQVVLPDGSRFVHAVAKSQRHPVGFGRELAARLAGVPQRADWKNCKVDAEKEKEITAAFKKLFKPYDIMAK